MRMLFTTQAGSGHWRPLLALARTVQAAGHEVAFASPSVACTALTKLRFQCFPVGIDDKLPHPGSATTGASPTQTAWRDVQRARHALPTLAAACAAWHPDLIVRETTEFAGCVAAELLGIPHAAIQVNAWRSTLPAQVGRALDDLQGSVGLKPDVGRTMLFRSILFTLAPPSFFEPAHPLPPTARPMRFIPGDVAFPASSSMPASFLNRSPNPIVVVTLETENHRCGLLTTILASLRRASITLIATTGPDVDPADLGLLPAHVHLTRDTPLQELALVSDIVICDGALDTVLTTLDAGIPLVIIPIDSDQSDNARRCAELGVAQVISPQARTVDAIRDAVWAVLKHPHYRHHAHQLCEEMHAAPDPVEAVRLLEHLVRDQSSLNSPQSSAAFI